MMSCRSDGKSQHSTRSDSASAIPILLTITSSSCGSSLACYKQIYCEAEAREGGAGDEHRLDASQPSIGALTASPCEPTQFTVGAAVSAYEGTRRVLSVAANMDSGVVVGIATGSVAVASLLILAIVYLIRKRRRRNINQSLGTQLYFVPPTITVVSDEDLEQHRRDPLVQEPTTTRARSSSTESQVISPLSRSTTVANTSSLSRTSTITNNNGGYNGNHNNAHYQAYTPPSSSVSHILEIPSLPSTLLPGSSTTPPPNGWMPPSPTTLEVPSGKVSPLSMSSQSGSSPRRLSPVQYPPPARQVSPLPSSSSTPEVRQISPLPGLPRPTVSRRSTTDPTIANSLYSIAETAAVVSGPKTRYYSAENKTRQSLIHIPETQNALPELPGCEPAPAIKKHNSWHSLRNTHPHTDTHTHIKRRILHTPNSDNSIVFHLKGFVWSARFLQTLACMWWTRQQPQRQVFDFFDFSKTGDDGGCCCCIAAMSVRGRRNLESWLGFPEK
ncbi:hypothetical protein BST61_g3988 [Cercospora zeina]